MLKDMGYNTEKNGDESIVSTMIRRPVSQHNNTIVYWISRNIQEENLEKDLPVPWWWLASETLQMNKERLHMTHEPYHITDNNNLHHDWLWVCAKKIHVKVF